MFDFVQCATDDPVLFNIESKVDGDFRNCTRSPEDFVAAMTEVFFSRGSDVVDRITHQSFDVGFPVLSIWGMELIELVEKFDHIQEGVSYFEDFGFV